jgi:hypothetical protein
MTHGSNKTFDVDLTSGNGIECRSGGVNSDFTIAFKFSNIVSGVDSITPSCGTVSSAAIGSDEHEFVVHLTGVSCNGQYVNVNLAGVHDTSNQTLAFASATVGLLIGDTNADTFVDSADIAQTKSQSGNATSDTNFREDINLDGFIDSADIAFVKSRSGSALVSPTPTPTPTPGAGTSPSDTQTPARKSKPQKLSQSSGQAR